MVYVPSLKHMKLDKIDKKEEFKNLSGTGRHYLIKDMQIGSHIKTLVKNSEKYSTNT